MRITHFFLCCLLVGAGGISSAAHASEKQQVVEVPFDFYRNEIILQVKVNGKGPFNMMLDTGTGPSAVALSTAREMGLKLHPTGKAASGGRTDKNLTYYTELPLVEVGGLHLKSLEALAIDLSKVSERLGKPLHGVLGHSLLNGRIVQFDYPNRIVRFYSQPLFSKAARQTKLILLCDLCVSL